MVLPARVSGLTLASKTRVPAKLAGLPISKTSSRATPIFSSLARSFTVPAQTQTTSAAQRLSSATASGVIEMPFIAIVEPRIRNLGRFVRPPIRQSIILLPWCSLFYHYFAVIQNKNLIKHHLRILQQSMLLVR